MIGQAASDALLVAAAAEAHGLTPSDGRRRALEWAARPPARSLRRAREGDPEERLIPSASDAAATVSLYADSIGEIEQTLAGEEDALDVYLKKTPGSDPYEGLAGLPGHSIATAEPAALAERPAVVSSPDEPRRDLLARS